MNLPDGVILEILTQAKHDDIRTLCQVNKQFQQICSDPRAYQRILELRYIVRARKVEKLLQLRKSFPEFWKGFEQVLPSSAMNEYQELIWEEILTFMERHPELHNQFSILFYIPDYSNLRKSLNDWAIQLNVSRLRSNGWAEYLREQIDRVTEYKYRQELINASEEALRQLFLKHPNYVQLMNDYIAEVNRYKPKWNLVAPRA